MKVFLIQGLFIFSFSSLFGNKVLKHTTIIIDNPAESFISIQSELTQDFIFEKYRSNKKSDTIYFHTKNTFRLVFSYLDNINQYQYVTFLIHPAETVVIKKTEKGFSAICSESDIRDNELNFFVKMQKQLGNFEGFITFIPHKRKDAESLLSNIKILYHERLNFLAIYKTQHSLSESFVSVLNDIFFTKQFIEFLEHCKLDGILSKELLQTERIRDFIEEAQLRNINFSDIYFRESEYLLSRLNYLNKDDYISYYYELKSDYEDNDIQKYILLKSLGYLTKTTEFKEVLSDFLSLSLPDIYRNFAVKEYGEYLSDDIDIEGISTLNDSSKDHLFHLKSQQIVTWQDVIQQPGIKIIDFWATWCGGCRMSFPRVKELQETYKSKNLNVIYVSIDEHSGPWKKVSKTEELPDENSYLLLNPEASTIRKKFNLKSVPNYLLISENGKLFENRDHHSYLDIPKFLDEQGLLK